MALSNPLPQIRFGKSNLWVSRIGLGLAALGRPGYINLGHAEDLQSNYDEEKMKENAFTVLDLAWAKGVRYFDVARSYGKAEEFLSEWLLKKSIAASEVVVGSKWGYTYTANWQVKAEVHEVKEHSAEVYQRQIAKSLSMLNDYLKIYHIHSATLESRVLENPAVLKQLVAQKEKKILAGLSLSGAKQADTLRKALEIKVDGLPLFESVQATWNVLEQSMTVALKEAAAEGRGIILKEVLANGRLTERNREITSEAKFKLLQKQAARMKTSVDVFALAAALHIHPQAMILSGAVTAGQLLSNLEAFHLPWDQEAEGTLPLLNESPDIYWKKRQELSWN